MVRALEASSVRFAVEPRDVPPAKAARRLHMTLAAFDEALPRLHARGFPRADPDTGNYDLKAIDAWMDRRSGLANLGEAQDASVGFEERLGAMGGRPRRR